MRRYTVLLDANLFYPAPTRDIFLQLAADGLFRARWTETIHREWIDALLRNRPDLTRERLDKTRRQMNRAVPDCLVEGYEGLIKSLHLPDPDDRHVLAAAIVGRCHAIITFNTKDFPKSETVVYQIDVIHPDDFLCSQIDLEPEKVCQNVRAIIGRLKHPSMTVQQYLSTIRKQGLPSFAEELQESRR